MEQVGQNALLGNATVIHCLVLDDLRVEHEKKSILLNVRLPCEIDPQKDAKFTFTYTIKLTNKAHDMPEITLEIDPQIQKIVSSL
jgi:hypothetical protein